MISVTSKVSEIVQSDFRTADVFQRYGISYCCSGDISLEEICNRKGISIENIMSEIEQSLRVIHIPSGLHFEGWKTNFLIDYIIHVHHAYLTDVLPSLQRDLEAWFQGHRLQYPELERTVSMFQELTSSKLAHIRHEEEIIFPYIKQIENAFIRKETYGNLFVRTLRKPLTNISMDHQRIRDVMEELKNHTSGFNLPMPACINLQVIFSKLKEIDKDLVQHTYLENNILFPRAIEMEKELLQIQT